MARGRRPETSEAMRRFAESTQVPVERTKNQIEAVLTKYGADQFISGWEHGRAMLGFRMHDRMVRFELPLPSADEYRQQTRRDQETRQRWRALLLVIKAKLEAVQSNIATFESEFLAHIVLPNNRTVGQEFIPQLAQVYKTGKMPKLLGDGADIIDAKKV
jgi:hypothetical protein